MLSWFLCDLLDESSLCSWGHFGRPATPGKCKGMLISTLNKIIEIFVFVHLDIGWDAWGPWSDCSRTCGGGASYSLRRCLSGGNCDGKNIRYRTCSNTDCPLESGDFRAQQCSAHNDIKYQGVTHEWVPAPYDSSAPCALRCQAKGGSLTVELAPKVLDGTRCRVDAFDMCISGVCQEVGCDRQLASGAREDNCGVCGGDGSTCQLVRGQALPHLTPEQLFLEPEIPLHLFPY
uniref:ADAMTS/ADAMTS-like cysteine-rich domain-containing protein n=1 Tax=Stegastes partitus TaxID=144197 RepID=A0A3B5AR01_9TELE